MGASRATEFSQLVREVEPSGMLNAQGLASLLRGGGGGGGCGATGPGWGQPSSTSPPPAPAGARPLTKAAQSAARSASSAAISCQERATGGSGVRGQFV
eukprot:NODE_8401_length_385_cov_88.163636.p1 GENE.NODE_8401_length_385_cov_88.163636~~NODE_8401_length_385_cov_88.163636.p1  ORF type:complete len:99 (+),score=13.31 NODE_8401_length_385_cov_88.163636:3-299(+)